MVYAHNEALTNDRKKKKSVMCNNIPRDRLWNMPGSERTVQFCSYTDLFNVDLRNWKLSGGFPSVRDSSGKEGIHKLWPKGS